MTHTSDMIIVPKYIYMVLQDDEEKEEDYDEEDLVAKAETDFFDTIEHAVKLREKKEAEKRKQEEALMKSSNEGGSGKVSSLRV